MVFYFILLLSFYSYESKILYVKSLSPPKGDIVHAILYLTLFETIFVRRLTAKNYADTRVREIKKTIRYTKREFHIPYLPCAAFIRM